MSFDAGSLFTGLIVSSIGFVLLSYGKKMSRAPHMAVGLVLMAYPYFVSSIPLSLGIAAGLLFALWLAVRQGF
jgi:ABC-type transport system involved in multi-copper enzyme maturation permease subunit